MTTPEDPGQPPSEGTPPPPPPPDYGAPPPQYGTPPPPPPQYGTPPAYQGPTGYPAMPPRSDYANWGLRVGSALIDGFALGILAGIFIVSHVFVLGYLLDLATLVWGLYNAYLGGSTGQSYGKRMMGTRLMKEDGSLLGGGGGIGRYFVHILDGIPCYLGFLWPLWDSKRQTFADKIMGTIVVKA